MNTLLISDGDITLDSRGDIAMATGDLALAQDAASAIKTFLGEVYWDTTIGIPYFTQIFGRKPPLALLKEQFIGAAKTVPDIVSVRVFLTGLSDRVLAGQVQVTGPMTDTATAANFEVINPQGVG